jgi:16S rRNA (cytidine1402-2'-O)-methyltransferase
VAEKNAIQPSTLYLVATPIGNLDDITFRALKVLKEVSLIAAEDTRNTSKLLLHFGIQAQKLISCFEHNEIRRSEEILRTLATGGSVALVTDAGMPGISDPGFNVVKPVLEKGFKVVPIPGASALTAALPASGLPSASFVFLGFLPSKASERREMLGRLKQEDRTLVFYESPHRLLDCLRDMEQALGERQAAVGRELTKLHEEFVRGSLGELVRHFDEHGPKGEFVVMVAGTPVSGTSMASKWNGLSVEEHLIQLIKEQGLSKTEAVKAVCKARQLPREEVYRAATAIKAGMLDESMDSDKGLD